MTLDGWRKIVEPIVAKKQYAYILFIPFVLISSYIILNIFIAIIVNGMRDARLQREEEQRKRQRAENRQYVAEQDELLLGILLAKLNEMEERILNPESGRATGSSNKTRDSTTRATGTGRGRRGRRRYAPRFKILPGLESAAFITNHLPFAIWTKILV